MTCSMLFDPYSNELLDWKKKTRLQICISFHRMSVNMVVNKFVHGMKTELLWKIMQNWNMHDMIGKLKSKLEQK